MISERQFSNNFASFWKDATPMADAYWRAQNLQNVRFAEPLKTSLERQSKGFVNELAFESFTNVIIEKKSLGLPDLTVAVESSKNQVAKYISRLSNISEEDLLNGLNNELHEVLAIAKRLQAFFNELHIYEQLIPRPKFLGCGKLMAAEGDLYGNQTLYEIKAGERNFRITDLRQLLTYCALNHVKPIADIKNIALVNPRVGIYWTSNIDVCSLAISGKSASELFEDIIEFVTTSETYI